MKDCPDCDGSGSVPGDRYTERYTCSTCSGTGKVPDEKKAPAAKPASDA
jgi:DnaJ-class molecular chaperone